MVLLAQDIIVAESASSKMVCSGTTVDVRSLRVHIESDSF